MVLERQPFVFGHLAEDVAFGGKAVHRLQVIHGVRAPPCR